MHMFPLHFSGVYDGMWLVPNFSIPAYFFCLTIAAKYWIEDSLVRRRTYFASTSISPAILLCGGAYFMPGYVLFPGFRSILAAMASAGVILYCILNTRKKEKNARQMAKSSIWKRVARIVCLLSICCVLFENWQKSIMVSYGFLTHEHYSMSLPTFSHYFLSIFSAIVLARFVKEEFFPRGASCDGGVS